MSFAAVDKIKEQRSRASVVLAVCCLAQLMVVLDVSVVMVALPQMRHDLHLTVTGQQWVVNAYTLTFAGFLMLGGRTADLFGRKRIFLLGLALFTACSLIGGVAQNGEWLIVARAAQGLGGAVLAPATLSLLTTSFPQTDQRRRALGAWSATAASGAAIGVLLGGVLTEAINWRWVLFINVPIGTALIVITALAVTESRAATAGRSLDVAGALTVTGGLAVLVYGIVGTDTHAWGSPATVTALAIGVALLAAFVFIEAKVASQPLVPLSIFRRRSISAANAIAVTLGASLFGLYFFLSLYIQQVNGYSPLRGGLAYLPAGLATLTAALVGTRLVVHIGPRRQLVVGPVLAAGGLVWLSTLSPGSGYWTHIFGPLVMAGAGFGLSFVPMTMTATAGLPPNQAGLAAGLINTTRQVGGAVGLAVMATIAANAAAHHTTNARTIAVALTNGYDHVFLIAAFALGLGAAIALLVLRPTKAGRPSAASAPAQDLDLRGEREPALIVSEV
jgi:EmrB/QacA subfamily drug resistance transporter